MIFFYSPERFGAISMQAKQTPNVTNSPNIPPRIKRIVVVVTSLPTYVIPRNAPHDTTVSEIKLVIRKKNI